MQNTQTVEPAEELNVRCEHYRACGGCSHQHIPYEDQVREKAQKLTEILAEAGVDVKVTPDLVKTSEDPWRYRNKMEFTFGRSKEGEMVLGMHRKGSYWKIVHIEDCWLVPERVNTLLKAVEAEANESGFPAYNPKSHHGFWRYLILRHSAHYDTVVACVITEYGDQAHTDFVEAMAKRLQDKFDWIRGFWWGVSGKVADVAIPDHLQHLGGPRDLVEKIGPFELRLHPTNFIQPNIRLAEVMYEDIKEFAALTGGETVYDLYCGFGIIAMYLAQNAARVYGLEIDPFNVDLGRQNLERLGMEHVRLQCGKVEDWLKSGVPWDGLGEPDLLVLDPPRAGMHKSVIKFLKRHPPKRMIYVSCNPTSLARDLGALLGPEVGYRMCGIQAYDMFPHTRHVETVVLLER
ncbi:MAG: 23S rRNA (uracil(1939)-C(5))-methyltransferase RlmD [Candidatus Omnitrophica bacterium]|nr:23S rRNA (uracil(1939)-C(5))-methyltransferase RlmD [Candidatus Omnitrophota bacterium]